MFSDLLKNTIFKFSKLVKKGGFKFSEALKIESVCRNYFLRKRLTDEKDAGQEDKKSNRKDYDKENKFTFSLFDSFHPLIYLFLSDFFVLRKRNAIQHILRHKKLYLFFENVPRGTRLFFCIKKGRLLISL